MTAHIYPVLARGVFATWGYFLVDEDSRHGFLIDPGAQPDLFADAISTQSWTVDAILLTHGHFDHMGAAKSLHDRFDIPIMAHEESGRYLGDPKLNLSAQHGLAITLADVTAFADGDKLSSAPSCDPLLEVLHTPGHTDDSCVFFCREAGVAFVGDTVYEGGPGLTVFPTGNVRKLKESIESRILSLSPDTVLLSGHSQPMTVGQLQRIMGK